MCILPSFSDFKRHGARHNVTRRQILSRGSIAFHESLPLAVDEVTSLPPAALCYQTTGTVYPCTGDNKVQLA